jgi:NAD(P)-dependent dehydrogenase (short-subunit alcohol dehydrogenase family)
VNVLVIGGSRGIGLELVRQYRADRAKVTATARTEEALDALRALGATAISLDVASAVSASRLAWQIDGEAFDVVVYGAGVYGPRTSGLEPPTEAEFAQVMATNVLGPMHVLPSLVDALAPGARLALMSSRMGSIGDRNGHQGWLYRASKAAVNSVLKDVSQAFAGRCTCVAMHPGWVQTDMGGAGATLTPTESAHDLRRVIAALTPADNGRFLDHDGSAIDW